MRRLLALALCMGMLASPALAQYYGGSGGYGGGGYGGGGYGRGHDDDDDDDYVPRRRPRYEERREYDRGGDYGRSRANVGSICITARGSCPTRPSPRGYPCRCDIPGFGEKRGNVQ